jgi:hypothetical protein
MFIYASLLGISAMNNMTPVYYGADNPLKDIFKSLVAIDNARIARPNNASREQVIEVSNWIYDSRFEFIHRLPVDEVHIGEFLQSWKYFRHIEPVIRSQFTLKDSYAKFTAETLKEITTKKG